MSEGTPWIVCRASFSSAAVRDALRDGFVAKTADEWSLDPASTDWPRAVDLLVDVAEGQEQTLLVGEGADVRLIGSSPSILTGEEDPFSESQLQVWSVPSVMVARRTEREPLDRWPRDEGELIDLAEGIERGICTRIEALLPSLVERTQEWLDELDARVARMTGEIDRLVDEVEADAAPRVKVDLLRCDRRAKSAVSRLQAAAAEASVAVPEVATNRAAPRRTCASGLGEVVALDDLVVRALVELLDAVDAARVSGVARRRTAEAFQEAVRWVGEQGSERLRKALELDTLPLAMGAYRDERLARTAPSWFWLPETDEQVIRDPINPTEAALDLLADARASIDSRARLRFHTKAKTVIVLGSLLDRNIWRPAMDWVDDDDIEKVVRRRGRSIGPAAFVASMMDEEPF